ncbi:MAG: hypothetical protein E7335_09025 [Clostridiales bacterium]|nr:hypothetical protein [Clostridiales bacterium]
MMKYLKCACIMATLFFLFIMTPALGEEEGRLIMSGMMSPGEMVVPGSATLTVFLQNTSDKAIDNVRIFVQPLSGEPEEIGRVESIPAGETIELVLSVQISQAQLNRGEYTIFSNSGGEEGVVNGSGNIGIPITKAEATVEMEFTRQLSGQYAARGDKVTVAYQVRNQGNVELRQIIVRDTLGDYESRISVLAPGETKTILNTVRITANTQSNASVEYVPQTERIAHSQILEPVDIYLSQERLSVQLISAASSVYYGGQTELTVRVKNTGNVRLNGISLTDGNIGMFTEKPFSLEMGETVEFTRMVTLFSDRQFQVTAYAYSPSGNEVIAKSNEVDVKVEGDEAAVFLSIRTQPQMQRINRAGRVTFEIQLINSGFGSVADVQIYERELGKIRSFTVIPAGETTVYYASLPVTETRDFQFRYAVKDGEGREYTGYSDSTTITIASDGETPAPLEDRSSGNMLVGNSTRPDTLDVYPYMIAGALALLAILTTLLAVSTHREKNMRKQRRRLREEAKKK